MSPDWHGKVRLLRARSLMHAVDRRMPRYDEAAQHAWTSDDQPDLVLFVSHRWRSTAHPDPDGRTWRAMTFLLGAIDRLGRGLDPTCDAPAPDLREPAMLHASVLLHRLLEDSDWDGPSLLDRIAVFFDFSCIPQAGPEPAQQLDIRNGLDSFPTMIPDPRVTLLALREPGDDYDTRAWCIAESVLALQWDEHRPWMETYPLRMDLDPATGYAEIAFAPLAPALDAWSRDQAGRKRITPSDFNGWLDVIQHCVDWHEQGRNEEAKRILHHSPGIAAVSFQLWMDVTVALGDVGDTVVDLPPLLGQILAASNLHCTDPGDIVPTALLCLAGLRWEELNRNAGLPLDGDDTPTTAPDFWRQCFRQHLAGLPLRAMVRQRVARLPDKLCPPALRLLANGE